ncbi:hypothetical protein HYU14_05895 [Candidatus Woesearchaeota archaeon]|nr:hypothetical protein [Candidatus Woesearchaeota archaeon]
MQIDYNLERGRYGRLHQLLKAQQATSRGQERKVPLHQWINPKTVDDSNFKSDKERRREERYRTFRTILFFAGLALLIENTQNPAGLRRKALYRQPQGNYAPVQPPNTDGGVETIINDPSPPIIQTSHAEPRDGGDGLEYQILKDKSGNFYVSFGDGLYQLNYLSPVPKRYTIIGGLADSGIGNRNMAEDDPLVRVVRDINKKSGYWNKFPLWGGRALILEKKVNLPLTSLVKVDYREISQSLPKE